VLTSWTRMVRKYIPSGHLQQKLKQNSFYEM